MLDVLQVMKPCENVSLINFTQFLSKWDPRNISLPFQATPVTATATSRGSSLSQHYARNVNFRSCVAQPHQATLSTTNDVDYPSLHPLHRTVPINLATSEARVRTHLATARRPKFVGNYSSPRCQPTMQNNLTNCQMHENATHVTTSDEFREIEILT